MVLGDNILQKGMKKNVDYFNKSNVKGHILGIKVPVKQQKRMGVATTNSKKEVLRYIEKPGVIEHSKLYNPRKSYAVPGFYFFDQTVFGCFKGKDKIKPSSRNELEISSAYNWLIEHRYKVTLDLVEGWYKDPGNADDTLITNQIILTTITKDLNEGKIDRKSKKSGKIRIEKGSVVKNSILRGPLAIGKNCSIENCYIGPYTSIYHNSQIKNCEIENSIVLGNVNIADVDKRIDSSLIGWNSTIGKMDDHGVSINFFVGDDSVVKL
jgi:glucose-1-phosphate thymidylyltransferase